MTSITLTINSNDYPMLQSLKKKNRDKILIDIFKTGYTIYFPNKDKTLEKQDYEEIKSSISSLRDEIIDSDLIGIGDIIVSKINERIEPLNNSLTKLLGLQTASSKKGELAENIIYNAFVTRYTDIIYEDKSNVPHSGDAWITLPNNMIIMIESKNYTTTVNKSEVEKMEYDMKYNNIRYCLFLSLNGSIQGFRDMDFHTFSHNGENYFALMISNLSNNIDKLDLAFNMMKILIEFSKMPDKFPWIQKKIHDGLDKINEIVSKNHILRDNFYVLEKSVQSSLDLYHKDLRNYQYELEEYMKSLMKEIKSTIAESIDGNDYAIHDILTIYKGKKVFFILSQILDIFENKQVILKSTNENKYNIIKTNDNIGVIDIQLKKIIINLFSNQLNLVFIPSNVKENNDNFEILNQKI